MQNVSSNMFDGDLIYLCILDLWRNNVSYKFGLTVIYFIFIFKEIYHIVFIGQCVSYNTKFTVKRVPMSKLGTMFLKKFKDESRFKGMKWIRSTLIKDSDSTRLIFLSNKQFCNFDLPRFFKNNFSNIIALYSIFIELDRLC